MVTEKKLTKSCPPAPCDLEHVRSKSKRILAIGLPCNSGNPIEMGLWGPHAEAAGVRGLHAKAGGSRSPSRRDCSTAICRGSQFGVKAFYHLLLLFDSGFCINFQKRNPKTVHGLLCPITFGIHL
jgi:hypothetical protein